MYWAASVCLLQAWWGMRIQENRENTRCVSFISVGHSEVPWNSTLHSAESESIKVNRTSSSLRLQRRKGSLQNSKRLQLSAPPTHTDLPPSSPGDCRERQSLLRRKQSSAGSIFGSFSLLDSFPSLAKLWKVESSEASLPLDDAESLYCHWLLVCTSLFLCYTNSLLSNTGAQIGLLNTRLSWKFVRTVHGLAVRLCSLVIRFSGNAISIMHSYRFALLFTLKLQNNFPPNMYVIEQLLILSWLVTCSNYGCIRDLLPLG